MPSPFTTFYRSLFLVLACLLGACSKPVLVNGEGYLGSDELLARLSLSRDAAGTILRSIGAQSTPDALCPSPRSGHELYELVAGASEQQRQRMAGELGSADFRSRLAAALVRLAPTLESPPRPWTETDEALQSSSVPADGPVPVWFQTTLVRPKAMTSLVRIIVHEALHVLHDGAPDDGQYEEFSEFRRYADYLGACVAMRLPTALRIDGTFRAVFGSEGTPLVLRLDGAGKVGGFLGASPATGEGRRLITGGAIDGNQVRFTIEGGAVLTASIAESEGRLVLTGDRAEALTPSLKTPWTAREMRAYFSDFDFADLSGWKLILGKRVPVSQGQLIGQGSPMYAMSPAPRVLRASAALAVNVVVASGTSAGVRIGDVRAQKAGTAQGISLFVGKQGEGNLAWVWRDGQSSPILATVLGSSPGPLAGELVVETCGTDLVAFFNGTEIVRMPADDAAIGDMQLEPGSLNGVVITGAGARLANFMVRDTTLCAK